LEDRGLDAIPPDSSEDRIKHDNLVVQYSRAISYLREILNHTFLRTVYHTSSRQAKLEYEEVQRNFINDHANDDPDDAPVKFTALDIINYIETECLSTNEKALQIIQNAISKMVRYNNQTLLDWLQSFVAPVNKYCKATAQQVLDADDAKMIWKDHFMNQITLSETSMMMLFQTTHLTPQEVFDIRLLPQGEFNERTLQKLITKLSSNFEPYKPDKAILQYLNNHARQLGLDPPSFANPKDKNNNSDKSEKNKSSSSDKKNYRTDRSNKKRKRTDASDFKSKSKDSKSKSRDSYHDKRTKEKFLLASNVATLVARNEAHTPIIDTKIVVSKMVINVHPSIQTCAKLLLRTVITKPSAIHHRRRDLLRPQLRPMIADVTFVTTLIIYLMLAHRKARISNLLKTSRKLIAALWLYLKPLFQNRALKNALHA
jgi:hypothetical protein